MKRQADRGPLVNYAEIVGAELQEKIVDLRIRTGAFLAKKAAISDTDSYTFFNEWIHGEGDSVLIMRRRRGVVMRLQGISALGDKHNQSAWPTIRIVVNDQYADHSGKIRELIVENFILDHRDRVSHGTKVFSVIDNKVALANRPIIYTTGNDPVVLNGQHEYEGNEMHIWRQQGGSLLIAHDDPWVQIQAIDRGLQWLDYYEQHTPERTS